jgi:CRP/FNR family transcriptional regulator, cyclic AMP receptor protein
MEARGNANGPPDLAGVFPILHKISLLGGLSDTQLGSVLSRLESARYRAGERVFTQGETPSHIYIIVSGRVKIVVDIDENPLAIVEYGPGQCFGETSAIGIQPHSATAAVVEDAELAVLSTSALHAIFKEDPVLFGLLVLNIAREACRRLHKTDQILLHYAAVHRPRQNAIGA